MKRIRRTIIFGFVSVSMSSLVLAATEFRPITLPRANLDLTALGFERCLEGQALTANRHILVCHDTHRDNEEDYGARLLIVDEGASSGPQVVFESSGARDAYLRRPTLFSDPKRKRFIILAEDAAEFSYGIAAFLIEAGHVKELGYLDVTAEGPENPVSAVPFTRITTEGQEIIFTFAKDVLVQEGAEEKRVSKGNIKYVYDGKQLSKVMVPLVVRGERGELSNGVFLGRPATQVQAEH